MGTHPASEIRNVCLVGHGDSGKTSLADALLHAAGAVPRRGSVKDKTSIFDFDELAKEKGHTVDASVAFCNFDGHLIHLIDTPGYPDFIGDAIGGVAASESAVICLNAAHGVQVNTRRVFEKAGAMNKSRCIVVTKCDSHDCSFDSVMEEIHQWFGPKCIPVTVPVGFGDDLTGTVRILKEKGGDTEQGKKFYEAFVESAVEIDEETMMLYLEGEEIEETKLKNCFVEAVRQGALVPVLFTSVDKNVGIEDVLLTITDLLPGADRLSGRKVFSDPSCEGEGELIEVSPEQPVLAQVFKLTIDKHVGRISYLRVLTGTIHAGDQLYNASRGKKEKFGTIVHPMGKDMQHIEQAGPGYVIAVTKLDDLELGATVAGEDGKYLEPIPFPVPMSHVAVRPKSRNDETKISEACQKLAAEIPTFTYHRDPVTHEAIASAMSQLQLDLAFRRLKDRYGIEVETSPARIPYREAITVEAEGHYRHKKQTGGRGQFGEVFLKVFPCEAGTGLQMEWNIVGGSIPSNFAPAIEKGIREKMQQGVIAGYSMPDVRVSVYDGKYHDVDSSEAAFKIAGGRAFAAAVQKARPVILEPMVDVEITVPAESMGDISGDLNTRRGRIQGMDAVGTMQIIKAHAPLASMQEYPRVLNSLTSGEGSFSYEPVGYEQVPPNVQAEIVASFKPQEEEE